MEPNNNNNPFQGFKNTTAANNLLPQPKSFGFKRLAKIAGGGLLVLLALFGLVKAIPGLSDNLAAVVSSVFIPNKTFTLNGPSQVNSGQTFTVNWTNFEKPGAYTLTYDCRENLYLKTLNKNGAEEIVLCNTEFPINATNFVNATFWSDKNINDARLYVRFKEDGSSKAATGVLKLNILTSQLVDGTKTPEVPTNVNQITNTGIADLSIRLLAIGAVDKNTNVFTPSSTLLPSQRVAAKFVIENIGTRPSGSWLFTADLPTVPAHTQTSDSQISLFPGERIEYTLGFDSISTTTNPVLKINVDPNLEVIDANRSNNTLNVNIPLAK